VDILACTLGRRFLGRFDSHGSSSKLKLGDLGQSLVLVGLETEPLLALLPLLPLLTAECCEDESPSGSASLSISNISSLEATDSLTERSLREHSSVVDVATEARDLTLLGAVSLALALIMGGWGCVGSGFGSVGWLASEVCMPLWSNIAL